MREASFSARFLWLDAATRPYYMSTKVLTQSNAFRVQVENGLDDVFFLHFSLVSIQFDISRYLKVGQDFWVYSIQGLFKSGRRYIAA